MRLTRWTTDSMPVSYCQYYLQGDDFLVEYDDADTIGRIHAGNGLAAGGPEHLTVLSGTHTGEITLTTEQLQDAPPPPGDEWETAVDVSICSTSGALWLAQWGGDVVPDAGNFAISGAGWYRVRVQTRGRDAGRGPEASDVPDAPASVEEHCLTIWPAPPAPDLVHRAADAIARACYDPTDPPALPIDPDDPTAVLIPHEYADEPVDLREPVKLVLSADAVGGEHLGG
ncbi:hypothetical protein [Streptomyces sp. NPDC020681]|uniref:hypothetical protein n=1 Tax=Streptomyces sp. NPDC020681 TaxID=3365083 RepID=UPI0037BB3815